MTIEEVIERLGYIKQQYNILLGTDIYDEVIDTAIKALKDNARPQGKWLDTGDKAEYWAEEYQCSICGAKDHWHNFCPNCGADMKGEEK